jgi:hypothetical protein
MSLQQHPETSSKKPNGFEFAVVVMLLYLSSGTAARAEGWSFDGELNDSLTTTGRFSEPTGGNTYGGAQSTTNRNRGLQSVSTSAPQRRGGSAPGNLALKQLGKSTLPPTKLNKLVRLGGESVFGGDGPVLPTYDKFTPEHRLERAMEQNPDLTTGHKLNSPSAWDIPE